MPERLVNEAVIGSLAKAMHPLADQLRVDGTTKHAKHADRESIDKAAQAAIARVPGLLRETLTEAGAALKALLGALDEEGAADRFPPNDANTGKEREP